MQASKLFSGEYYAYHPDPPKGRIPINAVKVRLRHTEARKTSFAQNRSTYAAITVAAGPSAGKELTVPARHLIDFWDNYQDEQHHLLQERKEQKKRQRRMRLRNEVTQTQINWALQQRSIPLTTSVMSSEVTIDVSQLLNWLDISQEQIDGAIEAIIAEEFSDEEIEAPMVTVY